MIRRLTPVTVLAGCLAGMPAAAQVTATIDIATTATAPVQPGKPSNMVMVNIQ